MRERWERQGEKEEVGRGRKGKEREKEEEEEEDGGESHADLCVPLSIQSVSG